MTKSNIKIIAKNINKSFDGHHVLNGIDFEVTQGSSFVILGGSGTGKSVLIKTIIGLIMPDKNSQIIVDGKDITFLPLNKRRQFIDKCGILFQGGALFDSLKVWQNISFSRINSGKFSKKNDRDFAIEKLKLVGMSADVADKYPAELSGGMQKRAALARAIANNPEIIFFDEPTAGLDPIMSAVITELISNYSEQAGATTITITHDMQCARRIADRVALIHNGKFIWQGSGKDLDHADNPAVNQFVHGLPHGPLTN